MKSIETLKPLIEALHALDVEIFKKQDVAVSLNKKSLVVCVDSLTSDYSDIVYIPYDCEVYPSCELSKWICKFADLTYIIDMELVEKSIDKKFKKQLSRINKFMTKAEFDKKEIWTAYSENFNRESFAKTWAGFCKDLDASLKKIESFIKIKLNDNYTATFNKEEDFVQVGCQRFQKSLIKALAAQF